MNNTEKLDRIRRVLRRIDTQLGIIQRTNVIMFERITGGSFPHSWVIRDDETSRTPFVATMSACRGDDRDPPGNGRGELGAASPGVTEDRMEECTPRRCLTAEIIVFEAPKVIQVRILTGEPIPKGR